MCVFFFVVVIHVDMITTGTRVCVVFFVLLRNGLFEYLGAQYSHLAKDSIDDGFRVLISCWFFFLNKHRPKKTPEERGVAAQRARPTNKKLKGEGVVAKPRPGL